LEICYLCSIDRIYFKIVGRRIKLTYQQGVNRSESAVIERAVGEWRQRLPFAFVLEADIFSTCCNKDNVM